MARLAIAGGAPVRTKPFAEWPQFDEREKRGVLDVLESGNWGGYPFPNRLADLFSQRFAAYQDAKHALCAANGTVTLEIARRAGREYRGRFFHETAGDSVEGGDRGKV